MPGGIFIFMNIEVYLLENKQLQYRTFLISEDSKKSTEIFKTER